MKSSHGLDQRVVHLLDGRHYARIGGIGVLQREQMRHLVVDIDARGIRHLLLQCIQHHGLAVGELLGGGCAPESGCDYRLNAASSYAGIKYPSGFNVNYEKEGGTSEKIEGFMGSKNAKGLIKVNVSYGGLKIR